jgi:hypothetical protein
MGMSLPGTFLGSHAYSFLARPIVTMLDFGDKAVRALVLLVS